HVVEVADPGDGRPLQLAQVLAHGQQVGERLAGVPAVGEQVDDRDGGRRGQLLEEPVVEPPGAEDRVVAGQHPGDVGDRLALAAADLLAPERDRVTAELHDRHLGRVPGPQRRLLEVQADRAPGERAVATGRLGGPPEHLVELLGAQVVDLQHVAHGHRSSPPPAGIAASTSPIAATAASISSSVISSGGARRRAVGVTALATTPASSSAATTAWASSPSSSTASSSPRPRTSATRGSRASPSARRAPAFAARPGTSSASIVASTARAAAMASGWPPKVVAWSPGRNTPATSARAQHAPTGTPLPNALAMVTTSGRTPSCWNPNQRPVRPRPVWTSSTISSTPRSSHSSRTPAR